MKLSLQGLLSRLLLLLDPNIEAHLNRLITIATETAVRDHANELVRAARDQGSRLILEAAKGADEIHLQASQRAAAIHATPIPHLVTSEGAQSLVLAAMSAVIPATTDRLTPRG